MPRGPEMIGMSISDTRIDLMEIENRDGEFVVLAGAHATLPPDIVIGGRIVQPKKFAAFLKETYSVAKPSPFESRDVVLVLPDLVTFTHQYELPGVLTNAEIAITLEQEAEEIVPARLEDLESDFRIVRKEKKRTIVLQVLAEAAAIDEYRHAIEEAGMRLRHIVVEPQALHAALAIKAPAQGQAVFVVDVSWPGVMYYLADSSGVRLTASQVVAGQGPTHALAPNEAPVKEKEKEAKGKEKKKATVKTPETVAEQSQPRRWGKEDIKRVVNRAEVLLTWMRAHATDVQVTGVVVVGEERQPKWQQALQATLAKKMAPLTVQAIPSLGKVALPPALQADTQGTTTAQAVGGAIAVLHPSARLIDFMNVKTYNNGFGGMVKGLFSRKPSTPKKEKSEKKAPAKKPEKEQEPAAERAEGGPQPVSEPASEVSQAVASNLRSHLKLIGAIALLLVAFGVLAWSVSHYFTRLESVDQEIAQLEAGRETLERASLLREGLPLVITVSATPTEGQLAGVLLEDVELVRATSVTSTSSAISEPTILEGVVTLVNEQDTSVSLVEQTRVLSAEGILFRLQSSVTIPANGELVAEVASDEPQTTVVPATTFTIPGLPEADQEVVYARSETTIGSVDTGGEVSEEDLDEAAERVLRETEADLSLNLSELLDENQRTFPEWADVRILSREVGDENQVEVTLGVSTIIYEETALRDSILRTAAERLGLSVEETEARVEFGVSAGERNDGVAAISVLVKGQMP